MPTMSVRSIIAFVVSLFLVSLSAAQETYTLKYGYAKEKSYRYSLTSTGSTIQEMMGQEMKVISDVNIVSGFRVEDVRPGGALVLIVTLESGSISVKNPMMDTTMALDAIKGKRRQLVLDQYGTVLERKTIDTLSGMGMLGNSLQQDPVRFHMLPTSAVAVGGTWKSAKTDTSQALGGNVINSTDVTYKVLAPEEKMGRSCLKISYEGTIMTEGAGSIQGMEAYIEGTGKTKGTLFFDPSEGVLVHDEATIESETTIALTGQQNMTIPMTQSMKVIQALTP